MGIDHSTIYSPTKYTEELVNHSLTIVKTVQGPTRLYNILFVKNLDKSRLSSKALTILLVAILYPLIGS